MTLRGNFKPVLIVLVFLLIFTQLACQVTVGPASSAPTDDKPGAKRSNPLPAGSVIEDDGMKIEIKQVLKGNRGGVRTMGQLKPDEEYIQVLVAVTCTKSKDEQCDLYTGKIEIVGSKDIENRTQFFFVMGDQLMTKSFYGGNTLEGFMVFEVKKDDPEIIMIYSPTGSNQIYLRLPEGKRI